MSRCVHGSNVILEKAYVLTSAYRGSSQWELISIKVNVTSFLLTRTRSCIGLVMNGLLCK